jgi:hypothetical protein
MKKLFAEIRRHNGKGGWYRIVTGGARLAGCWLAAGGLLGGVLSLSGDGPVRTHWLPSLRTQ